MARLRTSAAPSTEPGLDRTVRHAAQARPPPGDIDGAEPWAAAAVMRGRLRVRTLVTLRWLVVAGEALLLAVVMLMGFSLPYPLCFAIVGAGAWVNLLTGVASPGQRVFGDREAASQLSIDILQMGALLFLTGGTSNPFSLMLIAPVTLAAATLPLRPVLILGAMAAVLSATLAFVSLPLPQGPTMSADIPLGFRLGAALANLAGIALTAGYVRQAAVEASRSTSPRPSWPGSSGCRPWARWRRRRPTSLARHWPPSPSSPRNWVARRRRRR